MPLHNYLGDTCLNILGFSIDIASYQLLFLLAYTCNNGQHIPLLYTGFEIRDVPP